MPSFFRHFQKFIPIYLLIITLWLAFSVEGGTRHFVSESYGGMVDARVSVSCTIFTATWGDSVYFGNNEDYRLWGTYAWLVPGQEINTPAGSRTIHGTVFFGFDNNADPVDGWPQGGMNDQGLCLDGNGLSYYSLNPHYERENPYASPMAQILWECGTVEEVINWFLTHYIGDTMRYQLHVADATGDAVVVSAGPDNEVAFTRIGAARYLVSTNFNVADPAENGDPDWRYTTATEMLASITSEAELTGDFCRDVLDAVHLEGRFATKYSNVFDLVNRIVYLYYDRNFSQGATMSLDSELANVNPDKSGYIENDPLFGAYGANGDMYYRKIEIASLFNTPITPTPAPLNPLTNSIIAIIIIIIIIITEVIYLQRRRKSSTNM